MKSKIEMMINKKLQFLFKQSFQNDRHKLVESIQLVRDNGGSPADCTKILVRELKISIGQADRILWKSNVWKDIEEQTFKMRDDFGKALENFDEDI